MAYRQIPVVMIALLASACSGGERAQSGECPAGELCSDRTPNGLHFVGEDLFDRFSSNLFGPAPTAIGGTQKITLYTYWGLGVYEDFDLPFVADDAGGRGIAIESTWDSTVTIVGVGSAANYLRILDPESNELYDRYELSGAAIDRIELVGSPFEDVPENVEVVWAPGQQEIGVALFGEVQVGGAPTTQRLADRSMEISMPGAERIEWDAVRLADASIGTHTLSVTAGDRPPLTLDVEIVAGPTEVRLLGDQKPVVKSNERGSVCFAAMHQERYVYGLSWTFTVDGQTAPGESIHRNCVSFTADASGTVVVEAAAGGQSHTVEVQIFPGVRQADRGSPHATAGERAATIPLSRE